MSIGFTLLTGEQIATAGNLAQAIASEVWGGNTSQALLEVGSVFVEAGVGGKSFFESVEAYQRAVQSRDNSARIRALQRLVQMAKDYHKRAAPHFSLRQMGTRRFAPPSLVAEMLVGMLDTPAALRTDTVEAAVTNGAGIMMAGGNPSGAAPSSERVSHSEIARRSALARELYRTFPDILAEIPSEDARNFATRLVNQLKPKLGSTSLEMVRAVDETHSQLLSLKYEAIFNVMVDPQWTEPLARDILPKVETLLAQRRVHFRSLPAGVFEKFIRIYIRYWFGAFMGSGFRKEGPPSALTFASEVLHAAVYRTWKECRDEPDLQAVEEGLFYREAAILLYGLVTWELHRRTVAADSPVFSAGASYLGHSDYVRILGEHYPLLERQYDALRREGRTSDANVLTELVYKYVRFLHQQEGSRLNAAYFNEKGLEADVVRVILLRAEKREAYTGEALEALRNYFEKISGRPSPSLAELTAFPPAGFSSDTDVVAAAGFVPFQKGWTLARLIDSLPFSLGEADTRKAFELRAGVTYGAVRGWGQRRDLSAEKTPLDEEVAVEPADHQTMWAVYLEIDKLCRLHGLRLDFWDYLSAIFPTVADMVAAAQAMPDGAREIVVRTPNLVRHLRFQHLNYSMLAVGIQQAGIGILRDVTGRFANRAVERPHWSTLGRIATEISRSAGGDETHQKEIYHFLVMLRLIDVVPMGAEVRDVSGTVLSRRDPGLVSRYRLRIYPEDPAFKYDAGVEAQKEVLSARRWPVADILAGKFDAKLDILERRLAAIGEFLGMEHPLSMASGKETTAASLMERMRALRGQHNLYRAELNDLSHGSPLRQEGALEYVRHLRHFYRGVDSLFHEWLLLLHARESLQAGALFIPYVLVPSVGGVALFPSPNDFRDEVVAVKADDIHAIGKEAGWGASRRANVFRLRVVVSELVRRGKLENGDLRKSEKILEAVRPYVGFSESVLRQTVEDYLYLESRSGEVAIPDAEIDLARLLAVGVPPSEGLSRPYYVYVPLWWEDLGQFYREEAWRDFTERDTSIAEKYFSGIRHPHFIFNDERLKKEIAAVYKKEGERIEARERLLRFFHQATIATRAAPVPALLSGGNGDFLKRLEEEALKAYINFFPAARGLGVAIPLVETVIYEVIDRLLTEHAEGRGHRSLLARDLRQAVQEYNLAKDRVPFAKLEEVHPLLPLEGLLIRRLEAFSSDPVVREAYFALLPRLRRGDNFARQDYLAALGTAGLESNPERLAALERFVTVQQQDLERFREIAQDSALGVRSHVARHYNGSTPLIDVVALERLAVFYFENRILGVLPAPMDAAIIDEVRLHFAPIQEVREMAIRAYRILLNGYFRGLLENLVEESQMIRMALSATVEKSKAETREDFEREVALEYHYRANSTFIRNVFRNYQLVAHLFEKETSPDLEQALENGFKTVAARNGAAAEKEGLERERRAAALLEGWQKSVELLNRALAGPLPEAPVISLQTEERWKGSARAREDYLKVLQRDGKILSAAQESLALLSRHLREGDATLRELPRLMADLGAALMGVGRADEGDAAAAITEGLQRQWTQKGAEIKILGEEIAAKQGQVSAALEIVQKSQGADKDAAQLLRMAESVLAVSAKETALREAGLQASERYYRDYEDLLAAMENLGPVTFENMEELHARRGAAAEAFDASERRHGTRQVALERPAQSLRTLEEVAGNLESLARNSILHRGALLAMSAKIGEAITARALLQTAEEQMRARVLSAVEAIRQRFDAVLPGVVPKPLAPVPPSPDLASHPAAGAPREILFLVVDSTKSGGGAFGFTGNETFVLDRHGTFLVSQVEADRIRGWIRGDQKRPLITTDILGKSITLRGNSFAVLKRGGDLQSWREAMEKKPARTAYARYYQNAALLEREGHQVLRDICTLLFGDVSPQSASLQTELKALLASFDTTKGIDALEKKIQTWIFNNYDRLMAIPVYRKSLRQFFVVGTPFIPLRGGEPEIGRGGIDDVSKALRAMGLPVGDVSEDRWKAMTAKFYGIFSPDPKIDLLKTHIIDLLVHSRPVFGQIFDRLTTLSPLLFWEVVMGAIESAGPEYQKGDIPISQSLPHALLARLSAAEDELLYHDIFYHHHPRDWTEESLAAGDLLRQRLMPQRPDAYGFRVVGWEEWEGRALTVSAEQKKRILLGDRVLFGATGAEGKVVPLRIPTGATADQFRWTEPYNRSHPDVWRTVTTFYSDPSMRVCASIYEEAEAMAVQGINPDPFLLQILHVLILRKGGGNLEVLRAEMTAAYDALVLQPRSTLTTARLGEMLKEHRQQNILPAPSAESSAEAWMKYVKRHKTWLLQFFHKGYDRRLDEAHEGHYKALVREGASVADRETALSEWLDFLEESIRMADIAGMLKVEPSWADSYAGRYSSVFSELERLYKTADDTAGNLLLQIRRFGLVRQKMVTVNRETPEGMEAWLLYQMETESGTGAVLSERADSVAPAVAGAMAPPPALFGAGESGYQKTLFGVFGNAVAEIWHRWRGEDPSGRVVPAIGTRKKFGMVFGEICEKYLSLRRALPEENGEVLFVAAARDVLGGTSARFVEHLMAVAYSGILVRLYQRAGSDASFNRDFLLRDFPDLRVGNLLYEERPPTGPITP